MYTNSSVTLCIYQNSIFNIIVKTKLNFLQSSRYDWRCNLNKESFNFTQNTWEPFFWVFRINIDAASKNSCNICRYNGLNIFDQTCNLTKSLIPLDRTVDWNRILGLRSIMKQTTIKLTAGTRHAYNVLTTGTRHDYDVIGHEHVLSF